MKPYRNIETQQEADAWPNVIGARVNATWEDAKAVGWRLNCEQPPVPDGMTRMSEAFVDDDGERGRWVVAEVATAVVEAAEAAAVKAANIERWILDNAFLLVCQSYFGTLEKRGTTALLKKAFEIVAADQVAGMRAFAVVIGLDKELVRVAGDRWWDSCEWHNDPDAIAGAQAMLAEMGGGQ